jgi:hypothetical protein
MNIMSKKIFILLLLLFCCSCVKSNSKSNVMVVRTVPVSSSSHSGTGISDSPVPKDVVNYIIQKDSKWLTINNTQVNAIVNDFNACIQQSQRILLLCAEAELLHDVCKEYISNPLISVDLVNKKINIYDDAIRVAAQQAQPLLPTLRNSDNNEVRKVLDVLASDFLVVEAVATDAISPHNARSTRDEQIKDLEQVMEDNKKLYERLEKSISFIENTNAKQLKCRQDTLRHIPIILGENMEYNIKAIRKVVFPKTATRLSRFHDAIISDLNDVVANIDEKNIVAQLREAIMYNAGFIDFIAKVDDLYKILKTSPKDTPLGVVK